MKVDEFVKRWERENPNDFLKSENDNGVLNGEFFVSKNKKVRFSRGNLQFNACEGTHATADGHVVKGTWRFAEQQFDFVGIGNMHIDRDYNGWIDLFGWGTSGWLSVTIKDILAPWETAQDDWHYYAGNLVKNDLVSNCVGGDWGYYNSISNGGNKPCLWRTLTCDEWVYLFRNHRWTMAYVNGVRCVLLMPEKFKCPSDITLVDIVWDGIVANLDKNDYGRNVYTIDQFNILQSLGVVALPLAGQRNGRLLVRVGESGFYWSATSNGISAFNVTILDDLLGPSNYCERHIGISVRLVQDVQSVTKKSKNFSPKGIVSKNSK